jgi:mRNA-degrading endonuclease RelE of RelBE toxin-antitoxin system
LIRSKNSSLKSREALKLTRTERFKKSVLDLDPRTREKLRKQLGILISNPRHASLGVRKIKGTRSIFEARVDDRYRFTFEFGEKAVIILRVVGPHNSALKKP